jgi:hypothetical protein
VSLFLQMSDLMADEVDHGSSTLQKMMTFSVAISRTTILAVHGAAVRLIKH